MYRNLVLYRNELKNNLIPRYKIIGIIAELLLSKEIFKKNSDISVFLENIFSITYKNYILKSRTLIVAHCCKMLETCEEREYNYYKKRLLQFINEKIGELKEENNIKEERNQFDGWVNKL